MSLVQGLHNDWYIDSAPEDLTVLNVMIENTQGNLTDSADAMDFKSSLGFEWEVLADPEGAWVSDWGMVQHSYTVLNSDGTVAWRRVDGGSPKAADIAEAIEAAY